MQYTNFSSLNRRIVSALQTGADFTANQLRSRFGISSVSARISEIRKAGYPVYLNTRVTDNGRTIRVYRLGTPTREVVAAGQMFLDSLYKGAPASASSLADRLSLVS